MSGAVARGVLYTFLFSLSPYLGTIFFMLPMFPLLYVFPVAFRHYQDFWVSFWFAYTNFLLENVLGTKFSVAGDAIRRPDRALMLLNHRTRLDWMFSWRLLGLHGCLDVYRISLKEVLKHVPGAGWAMQLQAFLLFSRSWAQDQARLVKVLRYYKWVGRPYKVLIFPEGTDLSEAGKAKSDAWAETNDLPKYEYCMHPRTRGFIEAVKIMRAGNYLDAVYDLTISYGNDKIPQQELSIPRGILPSQIHFNVKRYEVAELPLGEVELARWCEDVWREKEAALKSVYLERVEHPVMQKPPSVKVFDTIAGVFFTGLILFAIYHFWILLPFVIAFHLMAWAVSRYTSGFDGAILKSM